ncbi:MAG TPA: bacterioferritin [Gammaproteobacteria bacterium]|nr:bacterioferritin [Gammaproteobacteria bacterium]
MKGDQPAVQSLNHVLKNELTATNQFFLHARMYKHWGLGGLNEPVYKASIKAMKQADQLMERVLFLEGLPNLQDLGKLLIGEAPQEMLQSDLKLIIAGREQLLAAIAQCESAADYVSRELLENILVHTEDHLDWLETQLSLVEKTGIENYLQSKI